jgi:[ribosomal protein S18]-alanine N-acetyltransferase
MMNMVTRFFARSEPVVSDAGPRDSSAIAAVHAVSFQRGWSEEEFERLLTDRSVIAHRTTNGRTLTGFILSRMAAGEAEILSVAVAPARRGKGLARALLNHHLRRLAGLGVHAIFLEVGKDNAPALSLYRHSGFKEVGQRPGYYQHDKKGPVAALVLRRDLT